MPQNHKCSACKERPAVVLIKTAYLCRECGQQLAEAVRQEGPVAAPSHTGRPRRLYVPDDVGEIAERLAKRIRVATSEVVEWVDVLRCCLDLELIDGIYNGDSQDRAHFPRCSGDDDDKQP